MLNKCLCGSAKYKKTVKTGFLVDSAGEIGPSPIILAECLSCGVIRQLDTEFTKDSDVSKYYSSEYPPTSGSYKKKTYEYDLSLASSRAGQYGLSSGESLLDIGTGSGAFVDVCRNIGLDAYGCELGKYSYQPEGNNNFIYRKKFEEINFPTDCFDKVTCHDVIEHSTDPLGFLGEMLRVTKQGGTCIIELPNFFVEAGSHHWKKNEHLWFFSIDQFTSILKQIGFDEIRASHPVESKVVFFATKPKQNRVKVLFPPGMGDSLWTLIKLESFLKKNKIKAPVDAYIVCNKERRYEGHRRSVPFLKLFPFVNSTGIVYDNGDDPVLQKIWKEAYSRSGRTVFKDVHGCDYFISYNGFTIGERSLQKADEYVCNWNLPMFVSLDQEKSKENFVNKYGNYIVLYFPLYGMYQDWIKKFSIDNLSLALNSISEHTGYKLIFAGAAWDKDDASSKKLRDGVNAIDLTGETTTDEVFGLIRGAKGMIAFPSGLPIMSTMLGQKTLMIWNDYWKKPGGFAENFAWGSCPPKSKNKTYFVEFVDGLTPEKLVNSCLGMLGVKPIKKLAIQEQPIATPTQSGLKRVSVEEIIPVAVNTEKKWEQYFEELEAKRTYFKNKNKLGVSVICSLLNGSGYSRKNVSALKNMLTQNITIPFTLTCFNNTEESVSDICYEVKFNSAEYESYIFSQMFNKNISPNNKIAYFGLGVVVVGNIDKILSQGVDFVALRPWLPKNQGLGKFLPSIMIWDREKYAYICNDFKPGTDYRQYLENSVKGHKISYIQDLSSGIYSYKRDCSGSLPTDAVMVFFHGDSKPHDSIKYWVKKFYN